MKDSKDLYAEVKAVLSDSSLRPAKKRLKVKTLLKNSGISLSVQEFKPSLKKMLRAGGIDPDMEWLNIISYELKAMAFPEDREFELIDEWEAHYWLSKLCEADPRLHLYEGGNQKILGLVYKHRGGGVLKCALTSMPVLELQEGYTWLDVLKVLCKKNDMLNGKTEFGLMEFRSLSELELKLTAKGVI